MNFSKIALAFGLAATTAAFAEKYEAETATLGEDAAVSGTIVKLNNKGTVTFNVTIPSAGEYDISIHYKNNYGGQKTNSISIGGTTRSVDFPVTESGAFADVIASFDLNAGANTVTITASWGWIDVDYISVDPHQAVKFTYDFSFSSKPVNANATPSAVKIYQFLAENFGKKTISGAMTGDMNAYTIGAGATAHEDIQAVFKASGKYPAMVGVDLQNATGASASDAYSVAYTDKALDIAKSIWQSGGIPAITWHWRPGTEKEFYTVESDACKKENKCTEFDFTKAFNAGTTEWNTASTEYQALVGDLDKIATILLGLQEAGIAAIFRPLHEAGGTWFWWSMHSGEQYAALYRLVYDRLVKEKGVNNLIWVFNPQDISKLSWAPGDEYYDVLGIDIYAGANDHQSQKTAFVNLTEQSKGKKIIAYSENGPIPDATKMYEDGATWSWWMAWFNSWSNGFIDQTSNAVWQANMASDKIITLDEMPGWDKYTPTAIHSTHSIMKSRLTVQGNSIMLSSSAMKDVSVDVFSMMGKHVATLHRGSISAGTHAFSLGNMARGNYIVRVKGAGINASQQIVVK